MARIPAPGRNPQQGSIRDCAKGPAMFWDRVTPVIPARLHTTTGADDFAFY
jgi:hypothetical protein